MCVFYGRTWRTIIQSCSDSAEPSAFCFKIFITKRTAIALCICCRYDNLLRQSFLFLCFSSCARPCCHPKIRRQNVKMSYKIHENSDFNIHAYDFLFYAYHGVHILVKPLKEAPARLFIPFKSFDHFSKKSQKLRFFHNLQKSIIFQIFNFL